MAIVGSPYLKKIGPITLKVLWRSVAFKVAVKNTIRPRSCITVLGLRRMAMYVGSTGSSIQVPNWGLSLQLSTTLILVWVIAYSGCCKMKIYTRALTCIAIMIILTLLAKNLVECFTSVKTLYNTSNPVLWMNMPKGYYWRTQYI